MSFFDRIDAGKRLASVMTKYHHAPSCIILGLPRGGVVVAYEIATTLQLPLDIICPRKIGAPNNPEFAIGAITETGEGFFNQEVIAKLGISENYLKKDIEKEKLIAQHRLNSYRGNRPKRDISNKTVILVDDGLATGLTMEAAISGVKSGGAKKIVIAVPVSPVDTLNRLAPLVNEVICLMTPTPFHAIGQFYQEFSQVDDSTVISLLYRT